MKQFATSNKNKKIILAGRTTPSKEGWMTAPIERASEENERSVIRN